MVDNGCVSVLEGKVVDSTTDIVDCPVGSGKT